MSNNGLSTSGVRQCVMHNCSSTSPPPVPQIHDSPSTTPAYQPRGRAQLKGSGLAAGNDRPRHDFLLSRITGQSQHRPSSMSAVNPSTRTIGHVHYLPSVAKMIYYGHMRATSPPTATTIDHHRRRWSTIEPKFRPPPETAGATEAARGRRKILPAAAGEPAGPATCNNARTMHCKLAGPTFLASAEPGSGPLCACPRGHRPSLTLRVSRRRARWSHPPTVPGGNGRAGKWPVAPRRRMAHKSGPKELGGDIHYAPLQRQTAPHRRVVSRSRRGSPHQRWHHAGPRPRSMHSTAGPTS